MELLSDIDKINNRIKVLGLLKSHVAKQVGISKVHLSYVLRGHKPISDELKTRLYAYLGIN